MMIRNWNTGFRRMGCYIWSMGGEHLHAISNVTQPSWLLRFWMLSNFRTITLLCQCFEWECFYSCNWN